VDFPETIAAIYRSVATGFERYFGAFTALGAGSGKQLALDSKTAVLIALCFLHPAAFQASLRLVGVSL
jgi:hypothetical protein